MAGVPLEAKIAVGLLAAAGVAYLVFTQSGGSNPATGSIAAAAASGGPTGNGPKTTFGVIEEDTELGFAGLGDEVAGAFGYQPNWSASVYSSVNGLNAQQSAAVAAANANNAVENAAAGATVDQLTSWGQGLLIVAGVGAALFVGSLVAPALTSAGAH